MSAFARALATALLGALRTRRQLVLENLALRHREGFRRYWERKSRRRPGRPGIDPELRSLIRKRATANPLWGAPRIHGELLKLGFDLSETTVSRYMPRRRKPPSPSWRVFLNSHASELVSIDFFTVPTARFQVLFCFLVLSHRRRRVLHFNVTDHPIAQWTARPGLSLGNPTAVSAPGS